MYEALHHTMTCYILMVKEARHFIEDVEARGLLQFDNWLFECLEDVIHSNAHGTTTSVRYHFSVLRGN